MDKPSFLYSNVYSDKWSGFILLRLLCYVLIKTAVTTLSQCRVDDFGVRYDYSSNKDAKSFIVYDRRFEFIGAEINGSVI